MISTWVDWSLEWHGCFSKASSLNSFNLIIPRTLKGPKHGTPWFMGAWLLKYEWCPCLVHVIHVTCVCFCAKIFRNIPSRLTETSSKPQKINFVERWLFAAQPIFWSKLAVGFRRCTCFSRNHQDVFVEVRVGSLKPWISRHLQTRAVWIY